MKQLRIDELTTLEAIEGFEPEWRRLWERSPEATPFQSPDWLIPWLRHLWGGGRLHFVVASRGDRPVALAPLFFWGYGQRPEVIRVSFAGSGISDYLGMVAEPPWAGAAAEALWEALGAGATNWHVCDLQELVPTSPLLHSRIPEGFRVDELPSGICPVLALPLRYEQMPRAVPPAAETPEDQSSQLRSAGPDLMSRLPSKFRGDLRRAGNRLRAAGAAEFRRAGAADFGEHLETLFRLHAERWENCRQSGVLSTDRLKAFHREAATRFLGAGMLRLYSLYLDGREIAVQYNLSARGRVYAYLAGFCPEFARLSPGAVLLAHSIERAIAEGSSEFDFLRKGEAFKYQWGATDRINRRLLLTRATAERREVA